MIPVPTTKLQKIVFAFLTVLISVHLFVFYNLAIEMGGMCNQVFRAARTVLPIEFICAFLLEVLIAGPLADKIAFRAVDPRKAKPYVATTAIICTTVCLMCPMMSFAATVLYDGFSAEFVAQWLQKIVLNFPFAFFSQMFFVQPLVRFLFGALFRKQRTERAEETESGRAADAA